MVVYQQGVTMITYDDFAKIDLRVATIESADEVDGSDKLVRLGLSLGEEKRQIIAGIKKKYTPVLLIGKQIIIVANLEPRILLGIESNGMLLAASSPDGPVLLQPDVRVGDGVQIK